jgi:hypothetical protein
VTLVFVKKEIKKVDKKKIYVIFKIDGDVQKEKQSLKKR